MKNPFHRLLSRAFCALLAVLASATVFAGPVTLSEISDSFTINGTTRVDGGQLNGQLTEVGNVAWSGRNAFRFTGPGIGTGAIYVPLPNPPAGGVETRIMSVPWAPGGGVTSTIQGDVLPPYLAANPGDFGSIGFCIDPSPYFDLGFYNDNGVTGIGQLWLLLAKDGSWALFASNSSLIASGAAGSAPGFNPTGFNNLRITYNGATNTVSAKINYTSVVINQSLGSFVPNIQRAGFFYHRLDGAQFDNFHVQIGAPATEPVFTSLYAKDGAVPNAGTDSRIQAGAVWSGFGSPAINHLGQVAFLGKWKAPAIVSPKTPAQSGAGIFLDGVLIAKVGEAVPSTGTVVIPPGAVFKSFKDPILDAGGKIAFVANMSGTGIVSTNDTIVVSDVGGTLQAIVREGDEAWFAGNATLKAIKNISMSTDSVAHTPTVLYTGTLVAGTGTPPVASTNDSAAWLFRNGQTILIAREGVSAAAGYAPGEFLTGFNLLAAVAGSPAQGRGLAETDVVTFNDKSSAGGKHIVSWEEGLLSVKAAVGQPAAGFAEREFQTLGAVSRTDRVAFTAMLRDSVTKKLDGQYILVSDPAWTTYTAPVASGNHAIDALGFKSFKDVVLAPTGGALAFQATLTGPGADATNDTSLWWVLPGGSRSMIAREGSEPPIAAANAGAHWKSFTSLALGGPGPLFTAKLAIGPGGITSVNDAAFYGVDRDGIVHELIREGQPLLGKTVKSFNVLKAAASTAGTTRAFNGGGQVIALVTFDDSSTAIVSILIY